MYRRCILLDGTMPLVGCSLLERYMVAFSLSWVCKPYICRYREQITCSVPHAKSAACSVHHAKLAAVQCISCVTLNIPVKESYHCSTKCFLDAWKKHLVCHHHAAEVISKNLNGNKKSARKLRSSGSWPSFANGSLFDEGAMVVEREGKFWVKVGSLKAYVPTMDDFGFSLRLESAAIDCSLFFNLSPINILVTDPVILSPPPPRLRCMIPIRYLQKPWNSNLKDQSSNEVVFSVLSYNILADLYALRYKYGYCPTWALVWEYRRQNLLHEIIEYHADILCLQEVIFPFNLNIFLEYLVWMLALVVPGSISLFLLIYCSLFWAGTEWPFWKFLKAWADKLWVLGFVQEKNQRGMVGFWLWVQSFICKIHFSSVDFL